MENIEFDSEKINRIRIEKLNEKHADPIESLRHKLSAAAYVAVYGPDEIGQRTLMDLFWPHPVPDEQIYIKKRAASLLASLCTAALTTLPRQAIEPILKCAEFGNLVTESLSQQSDKSAHRHE